MNTRRQVVQVNPTNTSSQGVFGDRTGLTQIVFEVPADPKIMNGKSLRVSGTFAVKNGDGSAPTNATNWCGNSANPALAPVGDIYIDGRTGVSSAFETISIQSLGTGGTYSTIKSYNRLCSSLMPLNESINSYLNGGVDSIYGALAKDVSQAKKCDKPFEFAVPILDGLIQGVPIDLSLVQGLRIVITLAPSNYVINNNRFRVSNSSAGRTDGGAFYEMSDLVLSFECETGDEQFQQSLMANKNGVLTYNTFTAFYNVINGTDHNLSLNINTGRTLSVISNLIPSSFVNNYDYDSQRTFQPLQEKGGQLERNIQVEDIVFTKGGLRIPLDFEVDSEETQSEGVADSLKNKIELNAIRYGWRLANAVKSLKTELSNDVGAGLTTVGGTGQARYSRLRYSINEEDQIQNYNIGVSMDHISENGLNFKGTPFGMRMRLKAPDGANVEPHSLYLFIKHKNSIMIQNGAISVMN
jgi:hypothetical protein